MDHVVERELTLPEEAEEVWRSLAEPEWLGEDARSSCARRATFAPASATASSRRPMRPGGSCSGGAAPGEDATRVEIELDETATARACA